MGTNIEHPDSLQRGDRYGALGSGDGGGGRNDAVGGLGIRACSRRRGVADVTPKGRSVPRAPALFPDNGRAISERARGGLTDSCGALAPALRAGVREPLRSSILPPESA